jgi:hypothetical protein
VTTRHTAGCDLRCVETERVPTKRYRVVIRGRLSERLGAAFPELSLERRPGQTVMTGPADGALHALLDRLGDLGIEPVSVDVDD